MVSQDFQGEFIRENVVEIVYRVSQNWLPRENRHVPTTKETPN
jgi:hypothetical protein